MACAKVLGWEGTLEVGAGVVDPSRGSEHWERGWEMKASDGHVVHFEIYDKSAGKLGRISRGSGRCGSGKGLSRDKNYFGPCVEKGLQGR